MAAHIETGTMAHPAHYSSKLTPLFFLDKLVERLNNINRRCTQINAD